MANISFVWLILVFHTVNEGILETWIAPVLCRISVQQPAHVLLSPVGLGAQSNLALAGRRPGVCFRAFLVISDLWHTLHTHTYVSVQHDRCPVAQVAPPLPGCWTAQCTTLCGWLNRAYAARHTLVRQFIHVLDLLPRLLHRLPLAQTTQDFSGLCLHISRHLRKQSIRLPLLVTATCEKALGFAQVTAALVVGKAGCLCV